MGSSSSSGDGHELYFQIRHRPRPGVRGGQRPPTLDRPPYYLYSNKYAPPHELLFFVGHILAPYPAGQVNYYSRPQRRKEWAVIMSSKSSVYLCMS